MPTNLPPDAKNKWEEVEATKDPREKLRLLEEFLSLVPRHHGTSRLVVQTKKQITNLRKEIEEKKRKKAARTGPKIFIEKEGAAQIAIIGLTKSGKSSLLRAVTNAKVEVSANPYTTREPVPGIMNYQDIQFQIIEAPALMEGSADGRAWGLQTLGIARNADGLILVVDLSQNAVDQLSVITDEMEKARIITSKPRARVEVERKFMGAGLRIIVTGRLVDCSFKDVENLLKNYHVTDAFVRISGEATLEEVEDAVFESTVYKPTVIVANKIDLKGAEGKLKLLKTYVQGKVPTIAVSCENRAGLGKLGETLFRTLDIIRVYTKEPSEREYSKKPFILKRDSTIHDLAKNIHSDFKENFSFARVWAKRLVFSPQKVGPTFALQDGDIVEIHLK
jgi:ribosome-interacting GTPase 1